MKKFLLVVFLLLLATPGLSQAELLWSKELKDVELQLSTPSENTLHLLVQSAKPLRRVVSFSASKKSFQISFRDHSFPDIKSETFGVPLNPLIEGVRVSKDGEVEILLTEKGWQARRVQETAQTVLITGHFPKESFVVDTYIPSSSVGTTLQVWDAKIKERKVEPLRLEPLTLEEEKELEEVEKEGREAQDTEESVVGEVPVEVKAGLDLTDAEPAEDESTKTAPLAAALSAGSVDIAFDRSELVLVSGEKSELVLKNLGLATARFVLQVQELVDGKVSREQTNQIVVDSGEPTILPGENRKITLRYIRPAVEREKIFQVLATDGGDFKREFSKVVLFVQPLGGVARVAWTRDEKGITFTNNGNISSKFTEIQICQKKCTAAQDIYIYPSKKHFLALPQEATLKLTQVVGENRRSGVIPAVK